MKMVRAIFRLERENEVLRRLEDAGFYAMTKIAVMGRGQQRGIQVGPVGYDQLAKLMLLMVVEDADLARAVEAIEAGAQTGHSGDGKIFIQEVRHALTIRTQKEEF